MERITRLNQGGHLEEYDKVPQSCEKCVYHNTIDGSVVCGSDKECHVKEALKAKEPRPKVIIYSRVSTEKQTFEQQERTVNEWLTAHGMTATDEVSDEGVSGGVTYKDRNLGRIVLPMLHKGDTLIVSEVSRIGRSMSDINKFVNDELKPRGVRLVIVQMGIDLDCGRLKAIDEMLLFSFSFAAQMEKELIQERTKSALEVRKKKLEDAGQFISKAGNVVKKLGRPKKCDLSNAQAASAATRKRQAAEKPCNKAIWAVVKQATNDFKDLSRENFFKASITLQQMGVTSPTGKMLTMERVRMAYYNLRCVYDGKILFRRRSADYRILKDRGMNDDEIRKYFNELNQGKEEEKV